MTTSDKLREIAVKWCPWSEKTSFKRNGKDYVPFDQMVSDLAAVISEHYYPKEFTEWIGDKGIEKAHNDEEIVWILYKYNSMEAEKEFASLDDVFNYWKENEQ